MHKQVLLVLGLTLWAQTAIAQALPDTATAQPVADTAAAQVTPAVKPAPPAKPRNNSIYLAAGIAEPMAPSSFTNNWKMGYNGGIGWGLQLIRFEMIVWLFQYSFSLDVPAGFTASGGTFTSTEISIDTKYTFVNRRHPGRLRPYTVCGLGSSTVHISEATIKWGSGSTTLPTDEATGFTVSVGGGMEIATSQTAATFVEGRYMNLFTKEENTAYLPIRGGLKLSLW